MRHLVITAVVAALTSGGCASTTTFRAPAVEDSDARLVVDEHEVGRVPRGGVEVPIPAGVGPVTWRIVEGGEVLGEGTLSRDEVSWGVVIGAGLAAACCIPTAAAGGFCLANPALLASPLACAAGNPGVCVTACQSPGWTSIPLTVVGAATGASPLAFGLLGAHLSPEVTLQSAAPSAAPATPAPATPETPPASTPAQAQPTPPSPSTAPEAMWF